MEWPLSHAAPGPRLSSLPTCQPLSSGGAPTNILSVLMPRCEWRSCSREREVADVWRNATDSVLRRWQPAEPIGDGQRTRCSLAPCRSFPLESQENQVPLRCHVAGRWVKVRAAALAESLTPRCGSLSGLTTDEKQPEGGLQRADRFIHHIP